MSNGERERWVPSGGARLWTVESGAGVPLLLFNGGPGCDDYLRPVAQLLGDACRVIRFEPRGCGRSDWDSKYDLDTLLTDANVIRRAYAIDRWIVAGHSHGTNLALAYAQRHPAHTLGVLGIAGGKITDDREWSEIYQRRRETEGEDYGGQQFQADPEVNRQGNSSWRAYCRRPALLRELAGLQSPCAFINAREDIRPHWPTEQLCQLLPRARYAEIAGAAHCIWLTHAAELHDELHSALAFILAEP